MGEVLSTEIVVFAPKDVTFVELTESDLENSTRLGT